MRAAISVITAVAASFICTGGYAQVIPGAPPGSGDHFQNVANAFQANQSTLAVSLSAHQSYYENNPSSRGLGGQFNVGGMGGGMPGRGFGFNGGQPGFGHPSTANRLYVRNQTGTNVWVEVSGDGYFKQIRVPKHQMRRVTISDGAYTVTYRDAVKGGAVRGDEHVSVFGTRAIVRLN